MLYILHVLFNNLWCIIFSVDISDLFDVHYELLNVAHNWRGVGRALRLHPDLLNRMEANTTDIETRLERALSAWLKREYDTTRFGEPSWELLVAAVAHPVGAKTMPWLDRLLEDAMVNERPCCLYTFTLLYFVHVLLLHPPFSLSLSLSSSTFSTSSLVNENTSLYLISLPGTAWTLSGHIIHVI